MNKMKQIIAKVRELLGDVEIYKELVNQRAVLFMIEEEGSLELSSIGFHKENESIIVGNMRIVYSNPLGKVVLYRFDSFDELLKLKK
jgi:hypothetical protein